MFVLPFGHIIGGFGHCYCCSFSDVGCCVWYLNVLICWLNLYLGEIACYLGLAIVVFTISGGGKVIDKMPGFGGFESRRFAFVSFGFATSLIDFPAEWVELEKLLS
jgi:hypothetical protein